MKEKLIFPLTAIGIFLLASFFRLYGVNWDQNQHLHPDERFLTMVTEGLKWPKNLREYFDTDTSPLNPHNRGAGFFVYGTFPIFFTKWVVESLGKGDYNGITIVGRQLSAVFDLGTVVLVFLIGKEILRNNPISTNKYQSTNKFNNEKMKKIGLLDDWVIGLLAAFFYAASVLPIQLSHFFAVETYLTFFITLTFYLCMKLIPSGTNSSSQKYQISTIKYQIYKLNIKDLKHLIFIGFSFGLALSSKITALLFLPIIILFFLIISMKMYLVSKSLKIKIFNFFYVFFILNILFLISSYFSFRLAQPYAFANPNIFDMTPNPKVIENWKQLKSFDDPGGGFPPSVQWIKTKPYIFPLKNMIFWGLGLPLGILSITAVAYSIVTLSHCFVTLIKKVKKQFSNSSYLTIENNFNNNRSIILGLMTIWIVLLFAYQGAQFVKAMRYFIPIYPFLAVLSGYFLYQCFNRLIQKYRISNRIGLLGYWVIGLFIIIYPLSLISIYSRRHSRVAASGWIYKNIPPGSLKSDEHWDDGLPLSLPTPGMIHEKYTGVEFPLYGADTQEKWLQMDEKLKKVDYIFLTSNRLYGSLTTDPEKYPITYKYYHMLFDGSLGFTKIAEFTSRPNIPLPEIKICLTPPFVRYGIVALKSQECPLPGISFVDDYADETFTVYDHPKVIIFKKVRTMDYLKVLYQ